MMLKLDYNKKANSYQWVSVIGDADGIRDLYWQLTRNHHPHDGVAIGEVEVSNLDGRILTEDEILQKPHVYSTALSRGLDG